MEVRRSVDEADGASIVLRAEALRAPGIAFCGEATITAEVDGSRHVLFTGLVERVEYDDRGTAHVTLAGLKRDFETTLLAGLQYSDCDAREIIFSLARLAGFPPERIQIQDWVPGPLEGFIVSVPVAGVSLFVDSHIGNVTITGKNLARLELLTSDMSTAYLEAGVWAYAIVQARTLAEAEALGRAQIEEAITLLRAIGYYSYPTLEGVLRPFEWVATQTRPRASPVTFVGSLAARRRWLRDGADIPVTHMLDLRATDIARIGDTRRQHPRRLLGRALDEWRKSVDALDDVSRVTHLWRAMESYSAGVSVGRLFSATDISKVRERLFSETGLTSAQVDRLNELVGRLNEPPLLLKLRRAMELDGVTISDDEFDALTATRSLRNDIEHGRNLGAAQQRVLEVATAIANRVLVTAMINLS